MKSKSTKFLIRLSLVSVFSAASFVLTSLVIPYGSGGYFNFGDVISILVSLFVGPMEGALVGIIGGAFSDLFLGFINYLPFTILAKALLNLIAGYGYYFFKNNGIKYIFPFIGAIFMALSYIYPNYLIYENTWYIYSSFDVIQGVFASIIAIILNELLIKSKAKKYLE